MSASVAIKEAERHGVKIVLNAAGDGLELRADKEPPDELLATLKDAKLDIVEALRRAIYDAAFADLQSQCPAGVMDDEWRQAINDAGHFLEDWAALAAIFRWTPAHLFDVPRASRSGLVWWLRGQSARALGPGHTVAENGRAYDRETGMTWINPYRRMRQ